MLTISDPIKQLGDAEIAGVHSNPKRSFVQIYNTSSFSNGDVGSNLIIYSLLSTVCMNVGGL